MPNNKDYWQKREEFLQEQLLKKGDEFYKNLAKEYDRAAAGIEKEINNFYQRFANENGISYADSKKILTSDERKKFQMSLEEYIEKGRKLNYSTDHAKILENASTVYRVSRLQELQLQMRQQVEELSSKYDTGMKKTASQIYSEGYYRNIYELQKGLGVGVDFKVLDTKTAQNIVAKPWAADGKNFSSRIWGDDKAKLVNYLETRMSQALIRGDPPRKLIDDIENKFGVEKRNAQRLVSTESSYFSSKATQDAYGSQGLKKFQFLATLDEKTCQICGWLESSEANQNGFDVKDYIIGVNAGPMHPNCRCTTTPYFPPDEFDIDHERAARDEDGKYYTVPDMTYNQWKEKYVDNRSKNGLQKKGKGDIIKLGSDSSMNNDNKSKPISDEKIKSSETLSQPRLNDYQGSMLESIGITNVAVEDMNTGLPKEVNQNILRNCNAIALMGKTNNKEYATLIDLKTGKAIDGFGIIEGKTTTVDIKSFIEYISKYPEKEFAIAHNHTNNTTFSMEGENNDIGAFFSSDSRILFLVTGENIEMLEKVLREPYSYNDFKNKFDEFINLLRRENLTINNDNLYKLWKFFYEKNELKYERW